MEFTDTPQPPFGEQLLDMPLETNLGYKTPLVFRIIKLLQAHGCLPAYGYQMAEVCLEEALSNAMIHGNKLDDGKQIAVRVFADDSRFGIIVEDEGDGFGPDDLPDPNDPETLLMDRGRGILLMVHYMDSVQYNSKGTCVQMVRQHQRDPDPGAVPPPKLPEIEAVPDEIEFEPVPTESIEVFEQPAEPFVPITIPDDIELDIAEPVGASAEGPVSVEQDGDVFIAAVHTPRIVEDNAQTVRAPLMDTAAQADNMILDMADVQFMSSVGISTIMGVYKHMTQKKGRMIICSAPPAVYNILDATGLTKLFKFQPDRRSALEAIRSGK